MATRTLSIAFGLLSVWLMRLRSPSSRIERSNGLGAGSDLPACGNWLATSSRYCLWALWLLWGCPSTRGSGVMVLGAWLVRHCGSGALLSHLSVPRCSRSEGGRSLVVSDLLSSIVSCCFGGRFRTVRGPMVNLLTHRSASN
jgi:hypothetical protein